MTYHDHWTDTNGLETEFVPMTDHHRVTDQELREMRERKNRLPYWEPQIVNLDAEELDRLVADCERYRALLRQLEEVMDEQPMWLRAICEALGETDNPNPKEIQP